MKRLHLQGDHWHDLRVKQRGYGTLHIARRHNAKEMFNIKDFWVCEDCCMWLHTQANHKEHEKNCFSKNDPEKQYWHLFYATSSFVQHFAAVCEFKLELQSENAQSRYKSTIFLAVWPWNLMDDLQNFRAPLLCYFKVCAAFRSHWWIQTGVVVWNCPIWVKIDDFC